MRLEKEMDSWKLTLKSYLRVTLSQVFNQSPFFQIHSDANFQKAGPGATHNAKAENANEASSQKRFGNQHTSCF